MKGNMEQRACDEAVYIIECRGTVRDAARKFGISKSTVHKDISQRLPLFNRSLYLQERRFWRKTRRSGTSGAAWPPGENIRVADKNTSAGL